MTNSNVPVRIPERHRVDAENTSLRPADWQHEKKPTRFIIKLGGPVPC